jgi:hypothetical protein
MYLDIDLDSAFLIHWKLFPSIPIYAHHENSRLGDAMLSKHSPVRAHVTTAAQVRNDGSANADVCRGGVVV